MPDIRSVTNDDVNRLVNILGFVRSAYMHHRALFSPEIIRTGPIYTAVAPLLFGDLNSILIRCVLLEVCKLTDPATDFRGNENLSVAFFVKYSNFGDNSSGLIELKYRSDKMTSFGNKLKPARDKSTSTAGQMRPERKVLAEAAQGICMRSGRTRLSAVSRHSRRPAASSPAGGVADRTFRLHRQAAAIVPARPVISAQRLAWWSAYTHRGNTLARRRIRKNCTRTTLSSGASLGGGGEIFEIPPPLRRQFAIPRSIACGWIHGEPKPSGGSGEVGDGRRAPPGPAGYGGLFLHQ